MINQFKEILRLIFSLSASTITGELIFQEGVLRIFKGMILLLFRIVFVFSVNYLISKPPLFIRNASFDS